jgi:hypothetical protein
MKGCLKKESGCWVKERSTRKSLPRPTASSARRPARSRPHSHLRLNIGIFGKDKEEELTLIRAAGGIYDFRNFEKV